MAKLLEEKYEMLDKLWSETEQLIKENKKNYDSDPLCKGFIQGVLRVRIMILDQMSQLTPHQ